MSRIPAPSSIETSPAASRPLLQAAQAQLGSVPNLLRVVGNRPAALEGTLALSGALGEGHLAPKTRASVNDLPIDEADRLFRWPLGRRPDEAPGLTELGL